MTRRTAGLASLACIAAMLLLAWRVGTRLPAGMVLPTHWNAAGQADGFSGKWVALLMPAAMTAMISALFWFLPALEPRGKGLERSRGLYLWSWISLLFLFLVIQYAVTAAALGWKVDVARLVVAALGVLLATIGNQLGKSRSMYMVGIRTPWTLASEEVWIRTHRLGGKLMTGAGLIAILLAALPVPAALRLAVVLLLTTLSALVPIGYSYWIWRREGHAQSSE